jgi:hypothetical protein
VPGTESLPIARVRKEELMPETIGQDTDLLVADVEDISWEDLVQEMLPEDVRDIIVPVSPCGTSVSCDPMYTCDF